MTGRAARLAAHREQLIARSARLRDELAGDGSELAGRFRLLDSAAAFARSGSGRLLVIGAAVLALLTGPGRALKVVRRVALVLPLVRPFLPQLLRQLRGWRGRMARAAAPVDDAAAAD